MAEGINWITDWYAQKLSENATDVTRFGRDEKGRPGFACIHIHENEVVGNQRWQRLVSNAQLNTLLHRWRTPVLGEENHA